MSSELSHKKVSKALDSFQAAQARDGDRRAFELLYKRWHAPLLRFAFRQTGNVESAKDVMQEAALAMAKNIHRLQDPEMFSSWAYTIVRRRAADHISANIKDRSLKSSFAKEVQTLASESSVSSLALRQGLAQLPEEQCLLLTLFYVEGLTGPELSAAMGVPVGTIKSRLFAAREHLKSLYENPLKGDKHDRL